MQHRKKTMDFVCMSMVLKSTTVPLHSMTMKTVFIVCATDVIMTLHLVALQQGRQDVVNAGRLPKRFVTIIYIS